MEFTRSDVLGADHWSAAVFADDESAELPSLPGRFCMFYQPDLELRTGSLGACEGLLRWWHPDFGMLRPDATLRGTKWTAEIPGIENWAMEAVCRQGAAWSRDGLSIQVALNVSRPHLASDGFLDSLDLAIAAAELDPTRLAVDIPVAALATDPYTIERVARQIGERGIAVVVDGVSGALGLDAASEVDAAVWKVDLWSRARRRPGMHPSVATALARAEELGVQTVAKAVEDPVTLQLVKDMGFDRAFGHVVSPAITPAAMSALLRGQRAPRRPASAD